MPRRFATFLWQFAKRPRTTGAIAPSSRGLAWRIVEGIGVESADVIFEFGAGTGAFTRAIVERMKPGAQFVAVEINPVTYEFARENLARAGYGDVKLILGDGSAGHLEDAPYDAVSITAASPEVPPPLVEQLRAPGRLIAPVGGDRYTGQDLLLLEKGENGEIARRSLMKVVYVPLLGEYGWRKP